MNRLIAAFVLFLIIHIAPDDKVYAAENLNIKIKNSEIGAAISCEHAQNDILSIHYGNKNLDIYFPLLSSSLIISKTQMCLKFASSLEDYMKTKRMPELEVNLEAYDFASEEEIRPINKKVYTLKDNNLNNACFEMKFCKSEFISIDLSTQAAECNPKFSFQSLYNFIKPKSLEPSFNYIDKVNIISNTELPFNEYIKKKIGSKPEMDSIYLGSTMNFGNYSAMDLLENVKSTKSRLLIAADAQMMLEKTDPRAVEAFINSNQIFILPMVPGEEFKNIFHWKAFLELKGNESALTSMNISNPLKTPYTDYIYEFNEPDVTNELRGLLSGAMETQCGRKEDFVCMASFNQFEAARNDWLSIFDKGCSAFEKLSASEPAAPKKYFMQASNTDLVFLITSLISEAKKEIIVLTNQISQPEILAALIKAHERGIKVFVMSAESFDYKNKLPDKYFINYRDRAEEGIPAPHMKVMIIDRNAMLFGTGNFTINALNYSRELFAVTKNITAIEKAVNLASRIYGMTIPHNASELAPAGLQIDKEVK